MQTLLSIKAKLFFSSTAMLAVFFGVVGVHIYTVSELQGITQWVTLAAQGQAKVQELKTLIVRTQYETDTASKPSLKQKVDDKISDIDQRFTRLTSQVVDKEMLWSVGETKKLWEEKIRSSLVTRTPFASFEEMELLFQRLLMSLDAEISLHQELFNKKMQKLKIIQEAFGVAIGIIFCIIILVSLRIGWRVQSLTNTARKISKGERGVKAGESGFDEVSQLGASFNVMTEELISSREYLNDMIHSMMEMLFVVKTDGSILKINQSVTKALGYTESELTEKKFQSLLNNGKKIAIQSLMKQKAGATQQFQLKTKKGRVLSIAVSATEVEHIEAGATTNEVVIVAKDMTAYNALSKESELRASAESAAKVEREKAEQLATLYRQLQETQTQLIYAAKMASLGEMAGGVAHEINNPLAIIHGKAGQLRELIEEGQVDQNFIVKLAEGIETTAIRISKIIKGLRSFARQDQENAFVLNSVQAMIDDTLELCRERLKNAGVEIMVEPVSPDLMIECSGTQITQVLLNLLSNSFDAIKELPEKWVMVDVTESETEIQVAVTDSGRGIPPEIRNKIMQPFFTTKPVGQGTGLGLSISMGIIEAHNGTLQLDTEYLNTRFVINLPKRHVESELHSNDNVSKTSPEVAA